MKEKILSAATLKGLNILKPTCFKDKTVRVHADV